MEIIFAIIAAFTLVSGIAAMTMRNLVHCALFLVLTFAGLACLFLQLEAQFVGFVQILVYIGAVAILIVFTILLTRQSDPERKIPYLSSSWSVGICIALVVLGTLAFSILNSPIAAESLPPNPNLMVKTIGQKLMTDYILPLEIIALLLTSAMIGAVIIAMREKDSQAVRLNSPSSPPQQFENLKSDNLEIPK